MSNVMTIVNNYYSALKEEKGLGLETHVLFPSQESFKDENWNRLYSDMSIVDLVNKVEEFKKEFPFDDFRSIIVDRKIEKKHVIMDSFFAYTLYNKDYPIILESVEEDNLPDYISVICLRHKGVYSVLSASLVDNGEDSYIVALPYVRHLGFFLRAMPKEELAHVFVRMYKTDDIRKHYPLKKNSTVNNLFIGVHDAKDFLEDASLTEYIELRGNDMAEVKPLKEIGGSPFKHIISPSMGNPELALLNHGFKVYRGERRVNDGLPYNVIDDEVMSIRHKNNTHHYIQYLKLTKS